MFVVEEGRLPVTTAIVFFIFSYGQYTVLNKSFCYTDGHTVFQTIQVYIIWKFVLSDWYIQLISRDCDMIVHILKFYWDL